MTRGCGVCGWPTRSAVCEACGAEATEAKRAFDDRNVRARAGARAEDWPELEHAFRAWRNGDGPKMIAGCLPSLGVTGIRHVDVGELRYWPIPTRTAALFVVYDRERDELGVEGALLELPERLEVPLMRYLLGANGALEAGAARYCVRDRVVVLRWSRRVAGCSPPELLSAIREVAARIDRGAEPLSMVYFAPAIAPKMRATGLDPAFLGVPRALSVLERGQRTSSRPPRRSSSPSVVASNPSPPSARSYAGTVTDSINDVPHGVTPLSAPSTTSHAASAPTGARSSLRAEAQERLAAAERFKALMDETVVRSRVDDPPLSALLQRAGIFRVHHEFGEVLPGAAAVLFAAGRAIVDVPPRLRAKGGLFGFGAGNAPALDPGILPPLMIRLGRDLGDVVDAPAGALPASFGSALVMKGYLRDLLEDLEHGTIQPEIKLFVLLGAVAEVLLRTPTNPERLEPLRVAYDEAQREPPLRGVARLRHLLSRLAQ